MGTALQHLADSNRGVAEAEAPTPVSPGYEVMSNINDNHCPCPTVLVKVVCRLDKSFFRRTFQTVKSKVLDSSVPKVVKCLKPQPKTSANIKSQDVSCLAVSHVPSAKFLGHPQNKGISPIAPKVETKHVKGVSYVNQCLFVPHVPSAPNAATNLIVGGRLQKFWQMWQSLGANPRVVSILKEGYTLPFKIRPPLTQSTLVKSGYANPVKKRFLKESLLAVINKLVVERVVVRSSLAFYNRLFVVPKPNNKWRPSLDLSQLNLYLQTGTFKMETPETVRLSLQKGEWVTLLDFSDAYFHIPINQRSRKYLRFFLDKETFTALSFGLATAPLGFTKVIK